MKPAKIEATDIMFWAGLVFIFIGLGIALGWDWALAVVGGILLALSLWLTTPLSPVYRDWTGRPKRGS
jgi:type VI protein secretion system component VasK